MKRRNPFLVLLFSLITLGIYTLFWLHFTRGELLARVEDKKSIWPVWYLLIPFALIIFAVMIYAVNYSSGNNPPASNSIVFLIGAASVVAMVVVPFIWFYKYSKVVGGVTHEMDGTTLYILWIVLSLFSVGFVWPLIVQLELNKFIDKQAGSATPQAPMPPAPTAPVPPTVQ